MAEPPGGTDARFLAGVFLVAAMILCVVGFLIVPDAPFSSDLSSLIPLFLGAAGFLVLMLVVDPALTPKTKPNRDEVIVWLSKTLLYRLPVVELPSLVGLLIALIEQSRTPIVFGALGTLVLAIVWWPSDQYFNAMRRRLQPIAADKVLDEALARTGGRLVLRTR